MNINETLADIEENLTTVLQETLAACGLYADNLRKGDGPYQNSWNGPYRLASPHFGKIEAAYRAEYGLPPNPYSPGGSQADAHKAFDILLGDEFITSADVNARLGGHYKRQIPSLLDALGRREFAGYRLEKGKVDGKVAYRIVKAEPSDA